MISTFWCVTFYQFFLFLLIYKPLKLLNLNSFLLKIKICLAFTNLIKFVLFVFVNMCRQMSVYLKYLHVYLLQIPTHAKQG